MPNYSSDRAEIESQHDDSDGELSRPTPRRRGRRGGRRRNNRAEEPTASSGAQRPPETVAAADEIAVSQQLRLLMSPKLVKAEWKTDTAEGVDPQLTYRPPATIETFGAKPAEAPVSAATFKKSESPLQSVVATVGSMAILAALYHFGYYEGSQAPPEPQQYAAAAPLPARPALLPDPAPAKPTPELLEQNAVALATPALGPAITPVSTLPPPAPPKPAPVPPVRSAATGAPRGLYLQIAALKDSAAARELESELRTAGFEAEILSPSDDGLIRVLSGPYVERGEARTAARKMTQMGIEAFLRRF